MFPVTPVRETRLISAAQRAISQQVHKGVALTFIDAPEKTVDGIAREVCDLFHQDALIACDRVRIHSVRQGA